MGKRADVPFYWKKRKAWYLKVTNELGRRSNRKLGDTRDEAFEEYEKLLTAAKNNRDAKIQIEVLFEDVVTKWLERQEQRFDEGKVTAKWLKRAMRTTTAFKTAHPKITVREMTPAKVQEWLKNPKPNYERTELGLLKQILKWAKNQAKMIDEDPLEALELPQMTSRDSTISATDQAKALACKSARYIKDLLQVALLTGCRPGELRELKWEHLTDDFAMAELAEHKTAKKTGRPRRIFFPAAAQRILRQQKRICDHVFLNSRKRPWTSNAVVQAVDAIRDETGVKFVAYDARHTFVTDALENEVPIATVSTIVGHSSTAMVARVYSKLRDRTDYLSDAVEKATKPKAKAKKPQLKIHKPA